MKPSEWLIKKEIYDFILDEAQRLPPSEQQLFAPLRALCTPPISTLARVNEIRDALEQINAQGSPSADGRNLIEDLKEELDEIEEDLEFSESAEGKNILTFQDYGQILYRTLRNDARFDDIVIMYHPERQVVVVQGAVESGADFDLLSDIISANPVPFPVEYKVTVNHR